MEFCLFLSHPVLGCLDQRRKSWWSERSLDVDRILWHRGLTRKPGLELPAVSVRLAELRYSQKLVATPCPPLRPHLSGKTIRKSIKAANFQIMTSSKVIYVLALPLTMCFHISEELLACSQSEPGLWWEEPGRTYQHYRAAIPLIWWNRLEKSVWAEGTSVGSLFACQSVKWT